MEGGILQNESSGDLLNDVEEVQELIDRELAIVKVLLNASSSASVLEQDDVCLLMRDCYDRMDKAKEILDRIWKAIPNTTREMVQ
jgi:hypothetical protein